MNETKAHREQLAQLAADYDWLEEYCRQHPDLGRHAGQLRLAAALTRNVVGGSLEQRPDTPLHIAVVGGAGSGKSTVANFLVGSVVAEANPQAGYTRHPIAFTASPLSSWPSYLGFLGPLRRLDENQPSNLDEDVYQVHPVTMPQTDDPLADDVIWDCPDMTTWASTGYVSRLIEISALADVIVYVASDERYNDEVPTQFLQMLVQAGKAVVVVLTKMREADAPSLVEHFKNEVLSKIHNTGTIPPIPIVAMPSLTEAERADPAQAGARYRVQLLNQILVLCPSAHDARKRTLQNAIQYLESSLEQLLDVAKTDLTDLETWKTAVENGRKVFEDRYRKEYLSGESFRRLDRTRHQLLELLEPPGSAQYIGRAFSFIRLPYTLGRDFLFRSIYQSEASHLPEQTVLQNALASWLEQLQAESLRRTNTIGIWKSINQAFDSGLKQQSQERFQVQSRTFELMQGDELDRAGRALIDQLEANTSLLNFLRYGKIALDAVAIITVIALTWIPSWYHLLLIPVAVAISHIMAECVVWWRVDRIRASARTKRIEQLSAQISDPLAKWFEEWPTHGGSPIERMQIVLRRVPENLKALSAAIRSPKTV